MIFDCRDPQQFRSVVGLHRLFEPAYTYWKSLSEHGLPNRRFIDPLDIPHLLPNIMLLDVLAGGIDFRYRLGGSAVEHNFGATIKGLLLSSIVEAFPSTKPVLEVKQHCVETASPYACDSNMFTHFGTKKQVYCFAMPLSDDGQNVTQIFAIGILEPVIESVGSR